MSFIEFDAAKSAANVRTRGIGFERFAEMDLETAIGDPPQTSPAFEVMKKMTVNRQQRNATAEFRHHM